MMGKQGVAHFSWTMLQNNSQAAEGSRKNVSSESKLVYDLHVSQNKGSNVPFRPTLDHKTNATPLQQYTW